MLHPFLVVTFSEIFSGVSTSRFFTSFGRDDGLIGASQKVSEFEGLDEITSDEGEREISLRKTEGEE